MTNHHVALSPADSCEHAYDVVSYDADIDWDPASGLAEVPGPWILLRCRLCEDLTIRQYHPGYYAKYSVLPYLRGDTRDITDEEIPRIHRFIQAHPHLVYAILHQDITQAYSR
jgi:hypothetical protein